MKITGFTAFLLTLFLAAPDAWADFIYYDAALPPSANTQPYPARSHTQTVRQTQPSSPLCVCQPLTPTAAAQQPAPPLPSVIVYPLIDKADRTVYFGFNNDRPTDAEQEKLESLASRLLSSNDVTSTKIVGYADRMGSTSYNEKLSRRRAEHIQTYLLNRGLIKPSGIETIWVGKSESSTHCSKRLPHAKLLACLQPDRKVEVNINYYNAPQLVYQPQPLAQPVD